MNRLDQEGNHVKQRSYINDFTNLYNMPMAEKSEAPKMLGFQKQMNQHKTPEVASS